MKELESPELILGTQTVQEVPVPHEYKLESSVTINRGHSLFELDTTTFKVAKVKLKSEAILDIKGQPSMHHKVHRKVNCIYVGALNEKNARKKFEKIMVDRLVKKADSDPEFRKKLEMM